MADDSNARPEVERRTSALNVDFVKQQVNKPQQGNFHSSSLKSSSTTMISGDSVNRTALHPGGIKYVISHHQLLFVQPTDQLPLGL